MGIHKRRDLLSNFILKTEGIPTVEIAITGILELTEFNRIYYPIVYYNIQMQDFVIVHHDAPVYSLAGNGSQRTLLLAGLSAGLATFVSNFTPNQPDVIRGKRTVTLMYSPEPGFRLVMVINL